MSEMQNFSGFFLDEKGHVYRLSSKKGFIRKRAFYKGACLGFKLGQVFVSIHQLKNEPLLPNSYAPPF